MKYKYSKTAKQRKEEIAQKKEKEQKKLQKKELKKIEADAKRAQKEQREHEKVSFGQYMKEVFSKKKNAVAAIVMAVVLGLTMIIVPIIVLTMPPSFDTDLPVAEIRLSNKDTLYFKLDYVNSPNAVNNFIFLAQEKYFEGTIIFDVQRGFIKMGGYVSFNPVDHKSGRGETDSRLPSTLTAKYGYSIRDDANADVSRLNEWGVLSTIKYNSGSTTSARQDFQMCGNPNQRIDSTVFDSNANREITVAGIPFGYAYDQGTLETLARLRDVPTRSSGDVSRIWRPPVKDIVIKKVKIHTRQAAENKWKNWNFYEVMGNSFSAYYYNTSSSYYDIK